MTNIRSIVSKHKIEMYPELLRAIDKGMDMMENSKDPLHDHTHPLRMLSDLDKLLTYEKGYDWSRINLGAVILAVCWHDVWKSRRKLPGFKRYLYDSFYEGIGSYRIFKKEMKKFGVDKKTRDAAAYSIRKHSRFQLLPRRSRESQLLVDLDCLDQWTMDRVHGLTESFESLSHLNPGLVRVGKSMLVKYLLKFEEKKLKFKTSKKIFRERRGPFVRAVLNTISDLDENTREKFGLDEKFLAKVLERV